MSEQSYRTCVKCGLSFFQEELDGMCPKCLLDAAYTKADGITDLLRAAPFTPEELAGYFPDLEIMELVGSGGMGAIYRVRQKELGRVVALKVLSDHLAADPSFVERFSREARVLAKLSHPNIVTLYDFGMTGRHVYLLMEFVDGVNLREAMETGEFSSSETLELAEELCSALKYAHGQGVLHRDIKPENILIDSEGRVKVADFGIAKLVGEEEAGSVTLTMQGSVLGSPHYMAPEQVESPATVDERADVYSLGVVLYELLTGKLPLGRFGPPSSEGNQDARLDGLVMKALERNRDARFQSVNEVVTQIRSCGQEEELTKVDREVDVEKNKSGRFALMILVAVISSSVVGVWWWSSRSDPPKSHQNFLVKESQAKPESIERSNKESDWLDEEVEKYRKDGWHAMPLRIPKSYKTLVYPIGLIVEEEQVVSDRKIRRTLDLFDQKCHRDHWLDGFEGVVRYQVENEDDGGKRIVLYVGDRREVFEGVESFELEHLVIHQFPEPTQVGVRANVFFPVARIYRGNQEEGKKIETAYFRIRVIDRRVWADEMDEWEIQNKNEKLDSEALRSDGWSVMTVKAPKGPKGFVVRGQLQAQKRGSNEYRSRSETPRISLNASKSFRADAWVYTPDFRVMLKPAEGEGQSGLDFVFHLINRDDFKKAGRWVIHQNMMKDLLAEELGERVIPLATHYGDDHEVTDYFLRYYLVAHHDLAREAPTAEKQPVGFQKGAGASVENVGEVKDGVNVLQKMDLNLEPNGKFEGELDSLNLEQVSKVVLVWGVGDDKGEEVKFGGQVMKSLIHRGNDGVSVGISYLDRPKFGANGRFLISGLQGKIGNLYFLSGTLPGAAMMDRKAGNGSEFLKLNQAGKGSLVFGGVVGHGGFRDENTEDTFVKLLFPWIADEERISLRNRPLRFVGGYLRSEKTGKVGAPLLFDWRHGGAFQAILVEFGAAPIE